MSFIVFMGGPRALTGARPWTEELGIAKPSIRTRTEVVKV